ncbi:mannose-1-phosphate guanyltransferase [Desulfamplus magnetovallimortis]|uniref:mannose-1-phosphate guanylyltransferase n=1 Tax=Desulfamplus magnetovallimortis TaxID=1246637 RepID=A0A1W1HKI5_9BACT|nr:mannose-1-phosphate guanylyltransferase/mannose-6-phosphate isomerase [Desulfamplus magnetovallimortis]SLM32970.1 mannose-1-phosphate guanyltransferase [Desulfamplus magnetovallimortis]
MIIPLVLAGGSGTRLWPLSRELFPKQLLNITDDHSMLENTLLRLNGLDSVSAPIIVCNETHRFMVAEQLRRIDVTPLSIMLEPVGRNTAPAIAVAALKALDLEEDPTLLVLPADHVIYNVPRFHDLVQKSVALASLGYLITFGIVPDSPETGYGYIKKGDLLKNGSYGACVIDRFVEKPDYDTARGYLESGEYLWNSGMFMFRASGIINELEQYEPEMLKACRSAIENGCSDLDFFRLDSGGFSKARSESIDYAVMEKTDKGAIMPFDAGWNDLGSWDALWQTGQKDEGNNVILGDVLLSDVKNSCIYSQHRLIAAVGIEDHVIVETKDALLVASRDRVQDVKKIVEQLRKRGREEAISHSRVLRPWGAYETIDVENRFQVKRITVKPGAKLSLQKHFHRAEHWTVVSGTAIVTRGDEEILLSENESTYIPLGTVHRLENPGRIPLELIEVQSGSYLGEDDIVRYDDVYGRQEFCQDK